MERKIYESKYVDYYYDDENKYIFQVWKNYDETMTEEDFKKGMLDSNKLVDKYMPNKSMVDSRYMNFIVTPELQKWVDTNITGEANVFLRKVAFIVPEDLFAQISIQQTNEEEEGSKYEGLGYFTTKEEALEWLLND